METAPYVYPDTSVTGKEDEMHQTLFAIGVIAALPGFLGVISSSAIAADTYKTQSNTVSVEILADGLNHPWAVEDMGNGGLLITERPGAMRIFRDGNLSAPIAGVPEVYSSGQGGLLDVALAPDFAQSRTIYFSYAKPDGRNTGTAIARARLSDDESSLEDVSDIFRMNKFDGSSHHFGSRIAVAADGKLFFTIGERGDGDRAQDFNDHAGSVLRINPDGTVPEDNSGQSDWLPEIWSIGHRNPQGADIDQATGTLYTVEHGARGGDEINRPEPGKNYGWPIISYGRHYSGFKIGVGKQADGYEQPVHYWDPSIAPGGMQIYRGEMFPEWNGDLIVTALKFKLLSRLDMDANTGKVLGEEQLFKGAYGRLRDVKVAADGALLLVSDEDNGKLLRVTKATTTTD